MKEEELTTFESKQARERVQQRIAGRSRTVDLLFDIAHFGGAVAMSYYRPTRSIYQLMAEQERSEYVDMLRQERQVIARLKKMRLIREYSVGSTINIVLTQKGHTELLRQRIIHCSKMLRSGELIFVVFDIPQSQKVVRDAWRRFLKAAGFDQLQKSVWYTTRDVLADLKLLVSEIDGDAIRIIKGTIA